jgi:hypothetical protein
MFLLAGLTAGCTAGHARKTVGQRPPAADLVVRVRLDDCTLLMAGPCRPFQRRCVLRCGPPRGSMPHVAAACAAVADLARTHPAPGARCLRAPDFAPSTAVVRGTIARRPFALRLSSGYSWCDQAPRVERDYWIVSTFPCSVRVIHTGAAGSEPYRRWAHATGCTAS